MIGCIGCQSTMNKKIAISPQIDPFIKSEWYTKIEKDTSEMKSAWLGAFDPYSFTEKKYIDMGLNVILVGEEPSNMDVIPVVNYRITYQSFMNWNGNDPIESIMELSQNTADCYIAKGNEIKCMVKLSLIDNKWKANEWGPFDKNTVAILSSIYFDKKENTINIYIESSNSEKPYMRIFITYKEKGKYMRVQNFGIITPLINDLVEFQAILKSGKEW